MRNSAAYNRGNFEVSTYVVPTGYVVYVDCFICMHSNLYCI
jgi:hypothetical protein